MNAATAGGLLGGMVEVKVQEFAVREQVKIQNANAVSSAGPMSANPSGNAYANAGADDAACVFSRPAPGSGQLRLQVRTMSEAAKAYMDHANRCGGHRTPLQAVGNEAMLCDAVGRGNSVWVVGRVRDRLFMIDLADRDAGSAALREKAKDAAEIVSGNLF